MDDAEKKAAEFIKGKKTKATITVSGAERKDKGWIVRGTTFEKTSTGTMRSGSSDHWTVEIDGAGEIAGYKFESGVGFAIT